MTVGELIEILSAYNEDEEVVIADKRSGYAYSIDDYDLYSTELTSFWGDDRNVVVIFEEEQLGRI